MTVKWSEGPCLDFANALVDTSATLLANDIYAVEVCVFVAPSGQVRALWPVQLAV